MSLCLPNVGTRYQLRDIESSLTVAKIAIFEAIFLQVTCDAEDDIHVRGQKAFNSSSVSIMITAIIVYMMNIKRLHCVFHDVMNYKSPFSS